tara:strand:+ start:1007 stop:1507 length:501 start_codon:yes stop_codon:yes gene_type:complete
MATNIGTGPQDIPLNQFLGQMAFMDDVPVKPSFQAVKNSSAYNFTANTATVVAGWNPNHNDGGMLNATTGIVTIPFSGLYWFYFSAMSQRDDGGDYQISIRKNGTLYVNSNDLCDSATTTYQQTTITTIIKCEKGDEIGFYGYNSSGTTSVIYQGAYTHIGGYQIH